MGSSHAVNSAMLLTPFSGEPGQVQRVLAGSCCTSSWLVCSVLSAAAVSVWAPISSRTDQPDPGDNQPDPEWRYICPVFPHPLPRAGYLNHVSLDCFRVGKFDLVDGADWWQRQRALHGVGEETPEGTWKCPHQNGWEGRHSSSGDQRFYCIFVSQLSKRSWVVGWKPVCRGPCSWRASPHCHPWLASKQVKVPLDQRWFCSW